MTRLTHVLFNTNTPLWRYSLVLFALSTIPAFVIVFAVVSGMTYAGVDVTRFSPPMTSTSIADAFGTIVFAPFIETYLLAVLITILSSFISNKVHVAIASGILWGLGHAVFGLLWFFGPAWVFFILTCAYIAWREKSFKHAYFAAFAPHLLINALGILFVHLGKNA